ncbi:MAG TPA: glycoside hydrolase family 15 protein [Thermoanaerobaculia bacterium]|jgi:oligosaccharide amylase
MPRDLSIGNGSLLVAFDSDYRLADFYYPHVGMENHAAARFRFGVWADDVLTWVEDASWKKSLEYLRETLVTDAQCEHAESGLRIRCHDAVDVDANVFIRKITVRNLREDARKIKLFLHQDFNLYGSPVGDTAMYDPDTTSIIHYKTKRYLLVNCAVDGHVGVTEYACGRSGIGGVEGTWRDAEDGVLSMTPIAQGAVDSTVAVPLSLEPGGSATVLYWICAGTKYNEVRDLDRHVREETASRMLSRTASYWYTWVNKPGEDLSDLPEEILELYRRSLLIIATQCDRGGAILAANDSDIAWGHNDHYSYLWTRDASFVCDAMDRAGFPEGTRRFLKFASQVVSDEGYFLHKYHPDGTLASLWTPWIREDGTRQLPIQEDQTALVIWLVARHYERTRDLELLRGVYQRLVVQTADFLARFRDPETGLPQPSFDIWEERLGVFTYTCATVYAGLHAASELANLFNEPERRDVYAKAATEVREAMVRHLWMEDAGRFARGLILQPAGGYVLDSTIDASAFATFYLDVFPPGSAMVEGTLRAVREHLWVQTEVGGIARYEGDSYHRISEDTVRVPGNPWILCTLWLAEHALTKARSVAELQDALDLVRWARSKGTPSGILPEQLNPYDGQPLSVAPFTWSHAQIVSVVRRYLDRLRELRNVEEAAAREAKAEAETEEPAPVDNTVPAP